MNAPKLELIAADFFERPVRLRLPLILVLLFVAGSMIITEGTGVVHALGGLMILELRQALRVLGRAKGFSAVVVLILGLGIGANTAIFSVVRSVLLRPLPFSEPERLVRLYESFGSGDGDARLSLAPLTWQRWREHNEVFEDIAAATGTSLTLGGDGEAQHVPAARVSFTFFSVLGLRPPRGRDFLPEEDQPGAAPVVVLGHGLWQRRFGGQDVVGQDVRLDGVPHRIVGVMPESFRHPYRAELWVPLALRFEPVTTSGRYLYAPARLKPGVSVEEARRSMADLCARIDREYPSTTNARGRDGRCASLRARPPAQDPRRRRRRLRDADRGANVASLRCRAPGARRRRGGPSEPRSGPRRSDRPRPPAAEPAADRRRIAAGIVLAPC